MVSQRIWTSTPIHLSCAFRNSDFSRLGADLAHFDPKWTIQNLGQWEGTVVPYLHRYWFPLEPSVWYMDEVLSCSGRSGVPMDLAVSQHAMFEIRLLRV